MRSICLTFGFLASGNPLGKQNPVAQSQYCGNAPRKSFSSKEGMVAPPPPSNSFGQDIASFSLASGVFKLNFIYALQTAVKFFFRETAEMQIESLRGCALNDARLSPSTIAEVLLKTIHGLFRQEQLMLVILLGHERKKTKAWEGQKVAALPPISSRGVHGKHCHDVTRSEERRVGKECR